MHLRVSSRAAMVAGALFFGGLAGVATAVFQGAAPRFVYASGPQGVRYYANPGAQNVAAAPRRQSVGPGTRDWTTGQRMGLHKPWLRSRG